MKKKMQKSKRKAGEINGSPVDGMLNEKMQKKRKAKGGNIDVNEHSQITPEGELFCFWGRSIIHAKAILLLDSGIEFSIFGSCYSYFK